MTISKSHGKNRDKFLDRNGTDEVTALDTKDAVLKKHPSNTDTRLDQGGSDDITAKQIKSVVGNVGPLYIPSNLRLLIHGDGPNLSTIDVDASGNNYPIQFLTGAHLSTTEAKFGGSSIFLDGVGTVRIDHSQGANDPLDIRPFINMSDSWTIDFWYKRNTIVNQNFTEILGSQRLTSNTWDFRRRGNFIDFGLRHGSGNVVATGNVGGNILNDLNWHHVAGMKFGLGTSYIVAIYFDGVLFDTTTGTNLVTADGIINIGLPGVEPFTGYIDEFRANRGDTFDVMNGGSFLPFFELPLDPYDIELVGDQVSLVQPDKSVKRTNISVAQLGKLVNIPTGINQVASGALAGEIWADSTAGNILKLGI